MAKEKVKVKTQEYTDWNSLIRKKFRHNPELSKLNLNSLIKKYEPFIYSRAGRYENYAKSIGSFLDIEDIASFGREGILNALKKYDGKRGVKFLTYAAWDIRAYMQRGIEESANLTPGSFENIRKVKKAMVKLNAKGINHPTAEELVSTSKLSYNIIKNTLGEMELRVNSLDKQFMGSQGESENTLEDIIPQKEFGLLELLGHDKENGRISEAVRAADLSEQEDYILKALTYEGKNNIQIGKKMKVSRTRVDQMINKIRGKLRHSQFFVEELSQRYSVSRN